MWIYVNIYDTVNFILLIVSVRVNVPFCRHHNTLPEAYIYIFLSANNISFNISDILMRD